MSVTQEGTDASGDVWSSEKPENVGTSEVILGRYVAGEKEYCVCSEESAKQLVQSGPQLYMVLQECKSALNIELLGTPPTLDSMFAELDLLISRAAVGLVCEEAGISVCQYGNASTGRGRASYNFVCPNLSMLTQVSEALADHVRLRPDEYPRLQGAILTDVHHPGAFLEILPPWQGEIASPPKPPTLDQCNPAQG